MWRKYPCSRLKNIPCRFLDIGCSLPNESSYVRFPASNSTKLFFFRIRGFGLGLLAASSFADGFLVGDSIARKWTAGMLGTGGASFMRPFKVLAVPMPKSGHENCGRTIAPISLTGVSG